MSNKNSNSKIALKSVSSQKRLLYLLLLIVIMSGGIYFVFHSRASVPGTTVLWQEDSAVIPNAPPSPGTNTNDCINRQAICHLNGSLVHLSPVQSVWQSNPASNGNLKDTSCASPGEDLQCGVSNVSGSFTWFGPYDNVPTGTVSRVCWSIKDITPGTGHAKVYLDIAFDAGKGRWVSTAIDGYTLPNEFKQGFVDECLVLNADVTGVEKFTNYFFRTDPTRKIEYRLKVVGPSNGKVQIDHVSITPTSSTVPPA